MTIDRLSRWIVVNLFFLFSCWSYAQITGKVIDAKTKDALPYVNVYYKGKSSVSAVTDLDGKY